MKLALMLHLYQPEIQEAAIVKNIAETCYLPLIKLIKKRKELNLTLNIPLSLLSKMEDSGYNSWIADVKDLHKSGRVELTGTGAYHPLITSLPTHLAEQQIILQEYGLGYYFGQHTGFEGETAVLIKEVTGFFPPELAVNNTIVNQLDALGYDWVLVDETGLPPEVENATVYSMASDIKLVKRNRNLSNLLSFQRSSDPTLFMESFKNQELTDVVIALDGEAFGHHNHDGILLLDAILDELEKDNILTAKVSEIVVASQSVEISSIEESSWGASDEDMLSNNPYPMWRIPGHHLHTLQWEVFDILVHNALNNLTVTLEGYENKPIWKEAVLRSIEDASIRQSMLQYIELHKILHSDQFWWASGKRIVTGVTLYAPEFIRTANSNILNYAEKYLERTQCDQVKLKINLISELLNATENS